MGVDRVDSDLDYSRENVVPCCTECNMRKGVSGYDRFDDWCKVIAYKLRDHIQEGKAIYEARATEFYSAEEIEVAETAGKLGLLRHKHGSSTLDESCGIRKRIKSHS